jgi:hypothetical protein
MDNFFLMIVTMADRLPSLVLLLVADANKCLVDVGGLPFVGCKERLQTT